MRELSGAVIHSQGTCHAGGQVDIGPISDLGTATVDHGATSLGLRCAPYLMLQPRRIWFMLLILPQQCLLLMHFVSAAIAIISGHYHDGYVPDGGSAFIFADQIWLLMVVVVHTFEYIEAL
jgi:hypothetical protein